MKKEAKEAILLYWKKVIKGCPSDINNWLNKENLYLTNNIMKNSTVLDVGCGTGRNVVAIANTAKKIVGIDNNSLILKGIKKSLSRFGNIDLLLQDAKKMSFKNNSFDYVICLGNTFGDFNKDEIKILKEMKRVVKNGGKLIISIYSERALPIRIRLYKKIGIVITKIDKEGTVFTKEGLVLKQFTKQKLKGIFQKAGLKSKIIETTPISYICEAKKS